MKTFKLHFILFLFSLSLSSCFRKYIVSEKEIRQHYDTLGFKPDYKIIKGEKYQIFSATFGNDSLSPIIFIHGAPGRWEGFRKQLDDSSLHNKFHLIAPDRPGYGQSYYKRKYRKTNLILQAELLEKVLELNLSGAKAILVSRSYGAPIAAYMAYRSPEKYSKLIMMAPAINPNAEKFFKFSKYGKWPPFRWIIPKRFKTATDEKYDHIKELCDIEHIWQELKVPTIIMYGGKDWVVTPENFEYAKQTINPLFLKKAILIPEAGHRISRSHSELLKEQILD